jgi:hypothetical protein
MFFLFRKGIKNLWELNTQWGFKQLLLSFIISRSLQSNQPKYKYQYYKNKAECKKF